MDRKPCPDLAAGDTGLLPYLGQGDVETPPLPSPLPSPRGRTQLLLEDTRPRRHRDLADAGTVPWGGFSGWAPAPLPPLMQSPPGPFRPGAPLPSTPPSLSPGGPMPRSLSWSPGAGPALASLAPGFSPAAPATLPYPPASLRLG